ncbi:hypothetical protein SEVIR_9G154950v4 [Setaria viridis]|uniref:Uncharacterized protein n=1 Tax=Setaria viridis TaxID=4556 RepID=A0A4U6SW18_SETVI|nr:hypothetical protein SEVIR_9G154950v2 [Setaria viridis]
MFFCLLLLWRGWMTDECTHRDRFRGILRKPMITDGNRRIVEADMLIVQGEW